MWTLVGSRFRYHLTWLAPLFGATAVAAVTVSLVAEKEGAVGAVWAIWILILSMIAQVVFYHQDLRERRMLLWLELPLPPRLVVGARLLVPLLLHLFVVVFAFLGIHLLAPWAVTEETLGEMGSTSGIALLVGSTLYLAEETGILLAGHRTIAWILQLVFACAIVLFALDPWSLFFDIEEPAGWALLHAVALVFGLGTFLLFQHRNNFLMGTDPHCGLPVDWSQAE